jgi:hypothetical protein
MVLGVGNYAGRQMSSAESQIAVRRESRYATFPEGLQ